jgi:hypothetical protein
MLEKGHSYNPAWLGPDLSLTQRLNHTIINIFLMHQNCKLILRKGICGRKYLRNFLVTLLNLFHSDKHILPPFFFYYRH